MDFLANKTQEAKGINQISFMFVLSYPRRYGSYLQLLRDDTAAAVHDLTLLMKHIKIFLSSQRVKTSSELSILSRELGGNAADAIFTSVLLCRFSRASLVVYTHYCCFCHLCYKVYGLKSNLTLFPTYFTPSLGNQSAL